MIAGLDTSTPVTSVAILGDGIERELHDDGVKPAHASRLQPLLEQLVPSWDEITLLCAGAGPGGFTVLRLGISSARAIAQARQIPVVGVSSLDARAYGQPGTVVSV